jgi:hypothetical protein
MVKRIDPATETMERWPMRQEPEGTFRCNKNPGLMVRPGFVVLNRRTILSAAWLLLATAGQQAQCAQSQQAQ